jgi:hypothetical protein
MGSELNTVMQGGLKKLLLILESRSAVIWNLEIEIPTQVLGVYGWWNWKEDEQLLLLIKAILQCTVQR